MSDTSDTVPPATRYFATSARDIEPLTAIELRALGAENVTVVPGGVYFDTDVRGLYRALLELRTAHRVIRPLREFASTTAEMLYSQVRRVRWEQLMPDLERTFAVFATFEHNKPVGGLKHTQFAALKIKDGICDRLRHELGARPNIDRQHPDFRITAHFANGRCALGIDAAGASLHERGYRQEAGEAPLRETLAAAILQMAEWDGSVPLCDPMCGSGTLAIEAALRARRIAPGLSRTHFAVMNWHDFEPVTWTAVVEAARAAALPRSPVPILASDIDPRALVKAQDNARRAGVFEDITFSEARAEDLTAEGLAPGFIITNPPYGERLGNDREVGTLYRTLAERWSQNLPGWKAFLLMGNLRMAREFNRPAYVRQRLNNGAIECRLLGFEL